MNSISCITITAALIAFISCNSPAEKVEHAKTNLTEAQQELTQARQDSVADYNQFMNESRIRIEDNNRLILALKESLVHANVTIQAKRQKRIDALDQRNVEMLKKIEEYKINGKDEWVAFKREFNYDMQELVKALKNMGVKNTK